MSGISTLNVLFTFLLTFFGRAIVAQQQSVFKALENDLTLYADSITPVGNASDVFIDIQCISDAPASREWVFSNNLPLLSPLEATQTSYNTENGILRAFTSFIHEQGSHDMLNFQCLTSTTNSAINFSLTPTLFFNGTIPNSISSTEELLSVCTTHLPTLPAFSVTVHNGSTIGSANYSYCLVNTTRGTFRSSSVVVGNTNRQRRIWFQTPFPPEVVKWVHDSEVIRLPCKIFGSGRGTLGVSFLKDGNEISTDSTESVYIDEVSSQLLHRVLVIEARRGNEGVYQCMGQVGNDGTTTITTSTYVNIQFLDSPNITISSSTSWRQDTTILLGQSDTPSMIVLNCSVDAHPIPYLSWTRREGTVSQQVTGHQAVTGFREVAYSELHVSVTELTAEVEFMCTAIVKDHNQTASTLLKVYSPILFTGQPVLTYSTRKSVNTLTCTARSIPIPDLTWFQVKNGVSIEQSNSTDTSVYHTVEDEYTLTVTLQLAPTNDLNVTGYFCRGSNGLFHNDSNMIHIMDSPPSSPIVTVVAVTARSAVIEWTQSLSLIAISHYSVLLYQDGDDSTQLTLLSVVNYTAGGPNSRRFRRLRPFSQYTVEVVAINIARNSTRSKPVKFRTSEAVPGSAPENVTAEAYDTDRIRVSWSPLPPHLRNGIILQYSVLYHPISLPDSSYVFNVSNKTEALLLMPLDPGVSYSISVSAETSVGRGPFSEEVIQQTYNLPPAFNSDPPKTISGFDASTNTIPLELPLVDFNRISHFWVIAMRLDNNQVQPLKNITDQFQDNTSFATYSRYIPINTPYIVAEMSKDIYLQAIRFFVLGDENSTQVLNDFPNLYRNGPLLPGSIYTVFVRGFVHSIPPKSAQDGSRMRRQRGVSGRQYSVFSSSQFLPPTSTLTQVLVAEDARSNGVDTILYAVIGIGVPLVILLVIAIIVILVVQKKMRVISKKPKSDDEQKYENASAVNLPSSNGTLPHGLTVTGGEVKPEEHIYEDPLLLKPNDADPTAEPLYKVPRPSISGKVPSSAENNDEGYEFIPPFPSPAAEPNRSRSKSSLAKFALHQAVPDEILQSSSQGTADGCYELMQHPVPMERNRFLEEPFGPPAAYLEPVGVSEPQESLLDYVQPTNGSVVYANTSPEAAAPLD